MESLTGMMLSGWDRISFFTALEIKLGRAANAGVPLPPITYESPWGDTVLGKEPFGNWLVAAELAIKSGLGSARSFL
jgi:hypothetical protein